MADPQVPQEAVEAALALVRDMAESSATALIAHRYEIEARRIAAMLPKPVDPAVLAVREIVATVFDVQGYYDTARNVRSGSLDSHPYMVRPLAAYHAGASSTKSGGSPDGE